jgi:hypothetical protein
MKIYLKELPPYYRGLCITKKLTPGKWYNGELTHTMYDPQTFQKIDPCYVVVCDDDKLRKVDAKWFITLEDWRENKINNVLDES